MPKTREGLFVSQGRAAAIEEIGAKWIKTGLQFKANPEGDVEALYGGADRPAPHGSMLVDNPLEGAVMARMFDITEIRGLFRFLGCAGRDMLRNLLSGRKFCYPKSKRDLLSFIHRHDPLAKKWPDLADKAAHALAKFRNGAGPQSFVLNLAREADFFLDWYGHLEKCGELNLLKSTSRNVSDQLWNNVGETVWDAIEEEIGYDAQSYGLAPGMSVYSLSYFLCYLEGCATVIGTTHPRMRRLLTGFSVLFETKKASISPLLDFFSKSSWIWPFSNYAICCRWPNEIHLDCEGRLHKDGAPAIYWKGWGVYCLHGVRVPKWLAEDKCEDIDPSMYFDFRRQADIGIRREFLNKVGIDRVSQSLNSKAIDSVGAASLYHDPAFGNWLFVHDQVTMDPVPSCCQTVEAALNWLKRR